MKSRMWLKGGVGLCLFALLVAGNAHAQAQKDPQAPAAAATVETDKSLETDPGGLTQEALSVYTLPAITIYDVADQSPAVPVITRFGTQFNVVTEEQISRQGALDFYDALRNVPGVMFQKKNIIGGQTSASLYMRGRGASHPGSDLTILFDDVPRSGVLYGQALADGIPVYALGGMELYKYPQPSRFGNGYGMINFVPKYKIEPGGEIRTGFEAGSYGTLAENTGVGARQGAVDIYAAQSYVRTDGHVGHSAASQESYYVNTGFQAAENWNIRLMANYVDAHTDAPDNPLTGAKAYPKRFDTETTLVTLTLANQYDQASGYLKGYYNDTHFYLKGESAGAATSRQSNTLYGLRARETLRLWTGGEVVAGFDLDQMDLENRQTNYLTGVKRLYDFPEVTVFSPYLAVSQMVGDEAGFHVIPSAGLRYHRNSEFDDKASPQAGLVLGHDRTALNFNYARGVNYPSPVVLQNFLVNTSLPPGFDTEKIKPEVVDHYEAGLTHTWPGTATLGATGFYDKGKDRIRAYMYGGAPDESFFNSSVAEYKIRGLELTGRVTPRTDLELFAGLTWLDAKATGDDGIERDKMPYTPRFALQTGFKWQFLENFQFSGDYQYLRDVYAATSMRTANPNSPTSNFADLTDTNKLPNISVVNLRLDYLFACEPLHVKHGKFFLSVDNVLGADYAYAMETSGTQKAYYYMPGRTFMAGFDLTF